MTEEKEKHIITFPCPVAVDPHIFVRIEEKLDELVKKSSQWDWAYQQVRRLYWAGGVLVAVGGLTLTLVKLYALVLN